MMKQLTAFLFCTVISLSILSSCSGYEDPEVVGKWLFVNTATDVKTNNDDATKKIEKDLLDTHTPTSNNFTIEFTDDEQVLYNGKAVGTYTIGGNGVTITQKDKEPYSMFFSMTGNTLILYSENILVYDTEKLTSMEVTDPANVNVQRATYREHYSKQ